ncbi:MAG TPA: hypothetical protein VN622_05110 [Clostridia bacterium]|nr:hypothetical protein [Clostridia bacterium]
MNLFSGSRFPGSVSFGKEFNNSGEYGIPGLAGLNTTGSARNFGVTWSALVPKLPSLTATFSDASNSSTVLGTEGDVQSSAKNFSLDSRYLLRGYQLGAYYTHQNMASSFPGFFGAGPTASAGTTSSYGVSASHSLPLSGSIGASWGRSTSSSEGDIERTNTTDTATVGVSFVPFRRLSLNGDVRYTSNLFNAMQQSIIDAGGVPIFLGDGSAESLVFTGNTYLTLGKGLSVNGHISHREQNYYGKQVSDTQYGGTVNYRYARPLFGLLYFSFGMVNNANKFGNTNLGFVSNVSASRKFGRWETSADFAYSQNVQTQVALFTTSSYSYGGFVRRRLTYRTSWHGSYRAMRSALTQREGDGNLSETISSGLTWRSFGVTGGYSQSHGTTVLTASGLLNPTPLPPSLITNDFVVFNGRSYTVGVNASPLKRMTISGYYSKIKSDTLSHALFSMNDGDRLTSQLEYRLRKLSLRAGYTRTGQLVSASGAPSTVVNSYYFGISRWFNVF